LIVLSNSSSSIFDERKITQPFWQLQGFCGEHCRNQPRELGDVFDQPVNLVCFVLVTLSSKPGIIDTIDSTQVPPKNARYGHLDDKRANHGCGPIDTAYFTSTVCRLIVQVDSSSRI